MSNRTLACPYCTKSIDLEGVAPGTRIICPACMHTMSVPDPADLAPRDPGKEIPELAPSTSDMAMAQTASLLICFASLAIALLLLFRRDNVTSNPFEFVAVAIIGVISAFVWAYLQFAKSLKSRSH